jgi:hypothetical protein
VTGAADDAADAHPINSKRVIKRSDKPCRQSGRWRTPVAFSPPEIDGDE